MIPNARQIADVIGVALRECSPHGNLDHAARVAADRIGALVGAGYTVERIAPDQGERLRLTIYANGVCTDIIEGPERWIMGRLLRAVDGTGKLGVRKVRL